MILSRIFPLCLAVAAIACAGSKNPPTDSGPADSVGDEGEPGDADDGVLDEGEDGLDDEGEDGGDEGAVACMSDADCVPEQCCHPTSCVPAGQAPDCTDVACTEECQPGTMDCGQGHCACQDGTCMAVIEGEL